MIRRPEPWHETIVAVGAWLAWFLRYYTQFGTSDPAVSGKVEVKIEPVPPGQE